MVRRILLVEDDHALRETVRDTLADEGHEVLATGDGREGASLSLTRHFDAVLLDLMLPGRSGYEILRGIRAANLDTPILVLTAKSDETDRVLGLDLGADDYLTKPFGLRELAARVRALLRRRQAIGESAETAGVVRVGRRDIDLDAFEVRCEGAAIARLSAKESKLLALLAKAAGKAVRRDRILDVVWGGDSFVGPRVVDTHIVNLRQKIEDEPNAPKHLLTVHGVGYRLLLDR
jgi:DNA-binding response OmpR family regulator